MGRNQISKLFLTKIEEEIVWILQKEEHFLFDYLNTWFFYLRMTCLHGNIDNKSRRSQFIFKIWRWQRIWQQVCCGYNTWRTQVQVRYKKVEQNCSTFSDHLKVHQQIQSDWKTYIIFFFAWIRGTCRFLSNIYDKALWQK